MLEFDSKKGTTFSRYVTQAPLALPRSPSVTEAVTGILLTHGAYDLWPHEKSGDIRFKLPESSSIANLMRAVSRIHDDFWICSHSSAQSLADRARARTRHEDRQRSLTKSPAHS